MSRFESGLKRVTGRPLFWAAIVVGLASFNLVRAFTAERPEPPPVLGQVPHFTLADQTGLPFGAAQLRGKVWIANFIFTRCPTVCPVFTQKMADLQRRVTPALPDVHLVSFSVDPEHDTPERLFEYAKRYRASPRMWSFLTGLPEDVRLVVRDGLKISMEQEGLVGDVPDIIHGTHFVLIDRQMRIRGYYDSDDPARIEDMLRDVKVLLNLPDDVE